MVVCEVYWVNQYPTLGYPTLSTSVAQLLSKELTDTGKRFYFVWTPYEFGTIDSYFIQDTVTGWSRSDTYNRGFIFNPLIPIQIMVDTDDMWGN